MIPATDAGAVHHDPAGISVAELKRAWDAVASGRFRPPTPMHPAATRSVRRLALAPDPDHVPQVDRFHQVDRVYQGDRVCQGDRVPQVDRGGEGSVWRPGAGELVVSVVGCVRSCGASTVALAIATAAGGPARVVECAPDAATGLAGASTAELGGDPSGWARGTRGDVLIDRLGYRPATGAQLPTPTPTPIPMPIPAPGVHLTVVDPGVGPAPGGGVVTWLHDLTRPSCPVVVVAPATVPGLRRLEATLSDLEGCHVTAAVVGPGRRHWPRSLTRSTGGLTRALDDAGRLVVVPVDRALAVAGVDSTPLPRSLLAAAGVVLGVTRSGLGWGHS